MLFLMLPLRRLTFIVALVPIAVGVTVTDAVALLAVVVKVVVVPVVPVLVNVVAGVSLMELSRALFDCPFTAMVTVALPVPTESVAVMV